MSPMRRVLLWVPWFVLLAAVLRGQSSWVVEPTGTTANLWGVVGHEGVVVAVGEQGTILTRSATGTWERRESGTTAWLTAVASIDRRLYACGEGGVILSSADGQTWLREAAPPGPRLNALRPGPSGDTAEALGEPGAGTVVRAADGSWTRRADPFGPRWVHATSGEFVGGQSGLLAARDDQAATGWRHVISPTLRDIEGMARRASFGLIGPFTTIAVGAEGVILGLPRGEGGWPGEWRALESGTTRRLRGVTWKSGGYVGLITLTVRAWVGEFFAVGEGGVILRSADGSQWVHDPSPVSVDLNAVTATLDKVLAVGARGTILTLAGQSAPVIVEQPRIINADGELRAVVSATGPGSLGYLWVHDSAGFPFPLPVHWTRTVPLLFSVQRVYVYNAFGVTVSEGVAQNRFINLSTLANVTQAEGALVAGFSVKGVGLFRNRRLLIRAVGPGLQAFGVPRTLPAPKLSVFANGKLIASNRGWELAAPPGEISAVAQAVGAFPLQTGSADSAVIVEVGDGSYTAHVDSADGRTGAGLIEVYDATQPTLLRLVNLSSRVRIADDGSPIMAGLVIDGAMPKRLLVRGIGPGLRAFGLTEAVSRPQIVLRRSGVIVAAAGAWHQQSNAAEIRTATDAAQAFPLEDNSLDAAMVLELDAGAYTIEVSSADGAGGMALIEAYEL